MTTIVFFNTRGGTVPGYIEYIQELAQTADVLCLQEVHNYYGRETLIKLPAAANRLGPVEVKQFRLLQDLLNETHQGHFAESLRGLHDCEPLKKAPTGIAMFIRRSIRSYGVSSALIQGDYDQHWDGTEPATRVIQSVFLMLDGQKTLLAHAHGLWTPEGKIDTPQRAMQTENIVSHLNNRLKEPLSHTARNRVILGGAFGYKQELEAFKTLRASAVFGSQGAQVLNEAVTGGFDTRTILYPPEKETREANFVLTSYVLTAKMTVDRNVPSDHAVLTVTV